MTSFTDTIITMAKEIDSKRSEFNNNGRSKSLDTSADHSSLRMPAARAKQDKGKVNNDPDKDQRSEFQQAGKTKSLDKDSGHRLLSSMRDSGHRCLRRLSMERSTGGMQSMERSTGSMQDLMHLVRGGKKKSGHDSMDSSSNSTWWSGDTAENSSSGSDSEQKTGDKSGAPKPNCGKSNLHKRGASLGFSGHEISVEGSISNILHKGKEAIRAIRDAIATHREHELEVKEHIPYHVELAKARFLSGNQMGAMVSMKKVKQFEAELSQITTAITYLKSQEELALNKIQEAMCATEDQSQLDFLHSTIPFELATDEDCLAEAQRIVSKKLNNKNLTEESLLAELTSLTDTA